MSVAVCGTFQSSLTALAKLAVTIDTVGLLVKCAPKAAIIVFFLARYVGSQKTGIVVSGPPSAKEKKVPPAAATAAVTQAGLLACVSMRSKTFLPAAAALATSESKKVQLKTPSVGSSEAQAYRMLTPDTSGLAKIVSLDGSPVVEREKTPRGIWVDARAGSAPRSAQSVPATHGTHERQPARERDAL
jgi:hypothetical protein